ncbi:MAG: phosphomannomutase/phosphoglucomutase [Candidatus Woesebacteria bacterium]|nr:MAG: phosphomannomutase/phosphoglucomutase [Candidatus Woesebacteria bacterium]
MKVSESIFRDYDIRGIAGDKFSAKSLAEYEKWYGKFPGITITPEVGKAIGKAYGSLISQKGGKKIVIGYEMRPYGDELKKQFSEGVMEAGIDVYDIGVSLSPQVYFSIPHYDFDGGVSVTGSHNVYFFNGFKMMGKNVYPVYEGEIQKMKKMIQSDDYVNASKKGNYYEKDSKTDYMNYLVEHGKIEKKLKVVLDCGNGSAGLFAPEILKRLGVDLVELFSEPDTSFPNHVPDPENIKVMQDLGKIVVENKADIGIALDADGDRFGIVTEKGETVFSDRLLLIIAKDVLSRNPGKKILYDVKCSRLLDKLIPEFGGVPLMHKTGHAPIKATFRDDPDVIFGGEISGHFYWGEDYYKIDDGVFSAVKFLSLISRSNQKVSEIINELPKTSMTPEIKMPCADEVKTKVVEAIREKFSKDYKTIQMDGVRVLFSETSWALVRQSNTSPYLTIRMEADSDAELIKIKNIIADELEKYPEIGDKLDRENVTSYTGKLGWR